MIRAGSNRAAAIAAIIALIAVLMSSCASYWTRKDCEKTNWFRHGQTVAVRGERVSADSFVQNCQSVNADIDHEALSRGFTAGLQRDCEPEQAYQTGKNGEFLSNELCDGDDTRLLRAQYEKGVREFCKESNGYPAGATGKRYNKICPKDLEAGFRREFNRGRKAYLASVIAQKESEIADLEREETELESKRGRLQSEMLAIGELNQAEYGRKPDPATNALQEATAEQPDPTRQKRRDQIQSRLDGANRDMDTLLRKRQRLRQEIREMNAEGIHH